MNIAKAKILGFEEDIKQLKDQSTPHAIQQVEEVCVCACLSVCTTCSLIQLLTTEKRFPAASDGSSVSTCALNSVNLGEEEYSN